MKKHTLNTILIVLCLSVQAQLQNPYGTVVEHYLNQGYDTTRGSLISYNAAGEVTSIVNRTYNKITKRWNNNSRYDYTVNADGNRSHFTYLAWSPSSKSWDTLSGFYTNWTSPVLRTHTEVWTYNGSKQHLVLDSHIYNANNEEILTKTYYWNSSKLIYEYQALTTHNYTASGMKNVSQSYWLDTLSQKWDTTGRVLYTYNAKNLRDSMLSQSYIPGNGFRNESMSVYEYDAEDKMILNYYLVNDGTTKGLEYKYKTEYTYHSDGRRDVYDNYSWNTINSEFEPYYREINLYKDFTGIDRYADAAFSIYPNPTSDKVNIDLPIAYIGSTLSMLSLEGKQVLHTNIEDDHVELDISDQPSGSYILMIRGINGATSRSMIIKK